MQELAFPLTTTICSIAQQLSAQHVSMMIIPFKGAQEAIQAIGVNILGIKSHVVKLKLVSVERTILVTIVLDLTQKGHAMME
jgi:hypothetical protein